MKNFYNLCNLLTNCCTKRIGEVCNHSYWRMFLVLFSISVFALPATAYAEDYYLAGDGLPNVSWDFHSKKMTQDGSVWYYRFENLPAASNKYKFKLNPASDTSWGNQLNTNNLDRDKSNVDFFDGGDNRISFNLTQTTDVTIYTDGSKVWVIQKQVEEPLTDEFYVFGAGGNDNWVKDWNKPVEAYKMTNNGAVAFKTFTSVQGHCEFKVYNKTQNKELAWENRDENKISGLTCSNCSSDNLCFDLSIPFDVTVYTNGTKVWAKVNRQKLDDKTYYLEGDYNGWHNFDNTDYQLKKVDDYTYSITKTWKYDNLNQKTCDQQARCKILQGRESWGDAWVINNIDAATSSFKQGTDCQSGDTRIVIDLENQEKEINFTIWKDANGNRKVSIVETPSARYTVTFMVDGSEYKQMTVSENARVARPADPAKEGFVFANWYTNADLSGNPYNFETPVAGDLTLYAKFVSTADLCTVTFDARNNTEPTSQTVAKGGYATAPAAPTYSGKYFLGWYADADCSGDKFDFASTAVTANITLYAKWGVPFAKGETIYLYLNDNTKWLEKEGNNAPVFAAVFYSIDDPEYCIETENTIYGESNIKNINLSVPQFGRKWTALTKEQDGWYSIQVPYDNAAGIRILRISGTNNDICWGYAYSRFSYERYEDEAKKQHIIIFVDPENGHFETETEWCRDLIIGAEETVDLNEKTDVDDLILKAEQGKSGQLLNPDRLTYRDAYFQLRLTTANTDLDDQVWYDFSVPFDVDINTGIYRVKTYQKTGEQLRNGVDYLIWEYDGAKRAKDGNGWKRATGSTIYAGKTYLIGFANGWNPTETTYRFKAKSHGLPTASTSTVPMSAYPASDEGHSNWNGLGTPSLHHIKITGTDFVHVCDINGSEYVFNPVLLNTTAITVGTAFFAQGTGSLTLDKACEDNHILHRAPQKQVERYTFDVEILNNGQMDNRLYVSASSDAAFGYEQGRDMQSWNSDFKGVATVWIDAYGKQLSVCDAPLAENSISYRMGIHTPSAGEYTLRSSARYGDAQLWLLQDGVPVCNLSESDYTLLLNQGTTYDYSLLIVRTPRHITTGMDDTLQHHTDVVKFVRNGVLYICMDGVLYDATGRMIK